jgi:hypothetical protein
MFDARSARQRHEKVLLALPHVIGVGTGRDDETGAEVIQVYVRRKVPRQDLSPDDVIPSVLDGVPVRVVPLGEVTAEET